MPSRHPIVALLVFLALTVASPSAVAQRVSRSASIPVSLRVLSHTSFEAVVPRAATVVESSMHAVGAALAGQLHTRRIDDAAARIVVSGSLLGGTAGPIVSTRVVCALEGRARGAATEPSYCVRGLLARAGGTETGAVPIAVLIEVRAEVHVLEGDGVPVGTYGGRVILTAMLPAY